jgi:RNA polymerase sigma-70 factor (ECF subfamily)
VTLIAGYVEPVRDLLAPGREKAQGQRDEYGQQGTRSRRRDHRDSRAVDSWFVREVLPLEAALVRFLRRKWPNASEIADLRQEVYVRVYDGAGLNGIPELTKPFVFAVARNLMIDRVRRSHVVSIELVPDSDALNVLTDDASPERIATAREDLGRLQSALDLLPPRCREVVVLRKLEGLSQREVAARMGIVEDTVERQLAKGIRALADALSEQAVAIEGAEKS